jgi:hypothetical protein
VPLHPDVSAVAGPRLIIERREADVFDIYPPRHTADPRDDEDEEPKRDRIPDTPPTEPEPVPVQEPPPPPDEERGPLIASARR